MRFLKPHNVLLCLLINYEYHIPSDAPASCDVSSWYVPPEDLKAIHDSRGQLLTEAEKKQTDLFTVFSFDVPWEHCKAIYPCCQRLFHHVIDLFNLNKEKERQVCVRRANLLNRFNKWWIDSLIKSESADLEELHHNNKLVHLRNLQSYVKQTGRRSFVVQVLCVTDYILSFYFQDIAKLQFPLITHMGTRFIQSNPLPFCLHGKYLDIFIQLDKNVIKQIFQPFSERMTSKQYHHLFHLCVPTILERFESEQSDADKYGFLLMLLNDRFIRKFGRQELNILLGPQRLSTILSYYQLPEANRLPIISHWTRELLTVNPPEQLALAAINQANETSNPLWICLEPGGNLQTIARLKPDAIKKFVVKFTERETILHAREDPANYLSSFPWYYGPIITHFWKRATKAGSHSANNYQFLLKLLNHWWVQTIEENTFLCFKNTYEFVNIKNDTKTSQKPEEVMKKMLPHCIYVAEYTLFPPSCTE